MSSFPSPPPSSNNGIEIAAYVTGFLVVFATMCVPCCYCGKKAREKFVQDVLTIVAASNNKPQHHVIPVSEVSAPTMENFLQEMAKEKPVRFTAQQLISFTNNCSTRWGSGGFGDVYKGQFPDGVMIAVKVLKRGVKGK